MPTSSLSLRGRTSRRRATRTPFRRGERHRRHFFLFVAIGIMLLAIVFFFFARRIPRRPSTALVFPPIEDTSIAETPTSTFEYLPPFEADTFADARFVAADLEDRSAAVIIFWARWCDACIHEARTLAAFLPSFGEQAPILIAIHRGDTESPSSLADATAQLGDSFTFLRDPDGKLFQLLGQGKPHMPLTLFVDMHSVVTARVLGILSDERVRVNMARIVGVESQKSKVKSQN